MEKQEKIFLNLDDIFDSNKIENSIINKNGTVNDRINAKKENRCNYDQVFDFGKPIIDFTQFQHQEMLDFNRNVPFKLEHHETSQQPKTDSNFCTILDQNQIRNSQTYIEASSNSNNKCIYDFGQPKNVDQCINVSELQKLNAKTEQPMFVNKP